ncbi:CNNM domain-containing protein [Thalassomonas actiniarum]|uniref:HlyC/CorC family transporter n=1 Tax=Thalassomonas actiniarum TaxID=485447 RepID=A0AAE9YKC6_9GAMM|nr:hemolysin family protein [Thalassomonas actiniarum]WDD97220.1 HlyC/CorC family transporter [Thalassomonas actiniarum]
MLLLITFIAIALIFSFLCSIAEAVILSVTSAHIAILEQEGKSSGPLLARLKGEINKPLAAILTLNTIAHTVGAAGAGSQATKIFGEAYLGIISAVLTFLILIFSEIIPKTLGAHYWKQLAPITAHSLHWLIYLLYPFVKLSEKITSGLASEPTLTGFSRSEFAVMAELSEKEGHLVPYESLIVQNILLLKKLRVKDAMTPRTVLFSLPESLDVAGFYYKCCHQRFSRIPIYQDERDNVIGYVLRSDILLAQLRGNDDKPIKDYCRHMPTLLSTMTLSQAFDEFNRHKSHIMLAVNEYGSVEGILTLEDLMETILGIEIVDEGDKDEDMQKLARQLWRKRVKKMGLKIPEQGEQE